MSVETPQIKIDPYKSEVPTAPVVTPTQIPAQDLQPNIQSAIYNKGTGITEIADGVMKGMLKGLQLKENRKFKTAEATMAAQDASIADSKKRYNDALMMYGKDDERTKAAWTGYSDTVSKAADARQAYAVPEKATKQPKGSKKSKTAASGAPAAGGFSHGLKQFLSRNPQIIPELSIIAMKSQVDPKLYGQMTPEMTQQKQQMDLASKQNANAQVETAARGVFDKYAGVDPDKLKSMPSSNPKMFASAYEEFENAKAVITPPSRAAGKYQVFVDENKQEHYVQEGDQIPPGWKLKEKTPAGSTPKVGTEQEFTSQALKEYGYTAENAPASLLKYIHAEWPYHAPQETSSTSSSTVDVAGKRTNTIQSSRGASAPKPPSGFSPIGSNGLPQKPGTDSSTESKKPLEETTKPKGEERPRVTGRVTPPPAAPKPASAPKAGRGRITAPPVQGGGKTLTTANREGRVLTEEKGMYDKATNAYQKQLNLNRSKAADPASLQKLNEQAMNDYNAAKAQIVLWKAGQIKAVGGDPWKHQARNDKGVTIGTMDGVHWVDVTTGYPVQE